MPRPALRASLGVGMAIAWAVAAAPACGGDKPAPAGPWPVDQASMAFFTAPDTQLVVPPPAGSAGSAGEAGSDGSDAVAGDDVPRMRVHLIDVGQGAATLVEFSCAAILIDTGGEYNDHFDSNRHLIHYLEAFFKTRPDLHDTLALLVLTHPHIDHTRGAMAVWNRFHVSNVVTDGETSDSGGAEQKALMDAAKARGIPMDLITAEDVPAGGMTDAVIDPVACSDLDPDIRVLWGSSKSHPGWNMNNNSVVTKIAFGKTSLLVTGDLQNDGIDEVLKRNRDALAADVYEVGHHGSRNATTKELLDAIHPKLALIGMGPPTRKAEFSALAFGHPTAFTVDLLEHALLGNPRKLIDVRVGDHRYQFHAHPVTAPIFATGWDGNVRVSMYADGMIALRRSGR